MRATSARICGRSASGAENGIRTSSVAPLVVVTVKVIASRSRPVIVADATSGRPPRPGAIATLPAAWSPFMCGVPAATTSSVSQVPSATELLEQDGVAPVALAHLGGEALALLGAPGEGVEPGPEGVLPGLGAGDAREVVEGGAGGGVDAVGLLEPAPDEQAAGEVPEAAGVGVGQPAARPGGADLAGALAVLAGTRY